ncbi:MAG: hypothetical protein K6F99_07550 [Lachnospiraceae bacterium]|nr:hypothetical protein [Lachnospiraceae bacterium]
MIDNTKDLKDRLTEINTMLEKIKKREKCYKEIPEGKIRVSTSNKNTQYFLATPTSPAYKYLPASEKEFIKKFLQREYDRKAAKILLKMKNLVSPIEPTDDIFIGKWLEENPGAQNTYPEQGKYETEAGEYVRSKSEKIIADTFKKMNIPYIYEPKIILDRNKTVFPDFACLNVRKRKTIIWEHLGLTDLPDYAVKNFAKLDIYEKNGYFVGDDIIISTETQEHPLDISTIKRKIERYLY